MPARTLIAVALALGALTFPAVSAAQSFAPLSGAAGCVVGTTATDEDAVDRCTKVEALTGVIDITVSPDDRHVYVATNTAILTFSRASDTGALTFAGCVSDSGDDGRLGTEGACTDGDALNGVRELAVSPDGRFVYATAQFSNSVVWLARNPETGALTPAGCLKAAPRGDRCGGALNLMTPGGLAVSPDGRSIYVVAGFDAAIAAFRRDAETGALTPGGCVSDSGSDGRCVNGNALNSVSEVAVSADGASVYALAGGAALTSFTRDRETGELTPRGCALGAAFAGGSCSAAPPLGAARALTAAPDGQVLLAAGTDSAISVLKGDDLAPVSCYVHQDPVGDDFEEESSGDEEDEEDFEDDEEYEDEEEEEEPANPAVAKCTPVKALYNVLALALSRDGKALFATSGYGYVAAFNRDPATGALTEFGCLEADLYYKSCAPLETPSYGSLATTSDGRSLYTSIDGGLAVLSSAVAVTNRTARMSRGGRIGVRLACPAERARACRGRVGGSAYRVARGAAATVQVRLPRRVRAAIARRGRMSVSMRARDADRTVRATGRRVLVSAR